MGTSWTVRVISPDSSEVFQERLRQGIADELAVVDNAMSTYREDSEITRFNHAGTDPFPVSAATETVVRAAIEIWKASEGAFDPTVGPLVDAWGFGAAGDVDQPPTDEKIAALLTSTGLQYVSIDHNGLRKSRPDLHLDLSAIAKGGAVDRVAERLAADGFDSFMVEVGGEISTRGRNRDGEPWRIAVERPNDDGQGLQRVLELEDLSIATSGDYRQYWVHEGVRYSHTIDPSTGRPLTDPPASVSVLHTSCMTADGWATAFMVLGVERGLEIANRLDLAVLFLTSVDGVWLEHASIEFTRHLEATG